MSVKDFGRWSFHHYRFHNGAKAFGVKLWFNSNRVSVEADFWLWNCTVMRERNW